MIWAPAPLVSAKGIDRDVNQFAFASNGAAYLSGASSGNAYVAANASGTLQPFQQFAIGLTDDESIAVGP